MTYGKDSPRIELRGKLDSLNAAIIMLQADSDSQSFIADLESIRAVVNRIQRCEACGKIFEGGFTVRGIDSETLYQRSHNPVKYYGLGHILPHCEMGRESAMMNFLRTLVRETELCAVKVFGENDGLNICHTLNRLSSAVYTLIYEYLPEGYDKVISFGRKE